MATISGVSNTRVASVPVSEQMKLVKFAAKLIKDSGVFGDCEVNINFLSSDCDGVCVRLLDGAKKTKEYVDGSYTAQIQFSLIYRRLSVDGVDERVYAIDKINQFGELVESIDTYECGIESVYINSINQQSNAGLIYRDDSGIEDNGATFILDYDKD